MAVYRSSSKGNTNGVHVVDDGTDLVFSVGGSARFKIRKSDNQLLLDAGVSADDF